jgi:hypothetical protein
VLRLPTFAGVGRLGLPLVAVATGVALWSTSWAMAAAAPGSAVTVAMPQQTPVRVASEQVGVSIPSVVFGQADGLGRQLAVGRHSAVVQIWLAAGSPAAFATVRSPAAEVHGCTAVSLRPASVTTLHCVVDVAKSAHGLTLTVATSVAGQHFQTAYAHRVG